MFRVSVFQSRKWTFYKFCGTVRVLGRGRLRPSNPPKCAYGSGHPVSARQKLVHSNNKLYGRDIV